MVTRWRFELQTLWLKVKCSTYWASGSFIKMVASARFELAECKSQSLVPYHLATRQSKWWGEMDSNHWTRRNRFTVCRVWPLRYLPIKNGAENRNRTRNLLITSQLLYQLSYFGIKWWAMRDSNSRPPACKADALTNWANRPYNTWVWRY